MEGSCKVRLIRETAYVAAMMGEGSILIVPEARAARMVERGFAAYVDDPRPDPEPVTVPEEKPRRRRKSEGD